jgi:midasin
MAPLDTFTNQVFSFAGLSSTAPLKEAMVGFDLLLARLNHWQEFNASASEDTSFAAHVGAVAGLAARWRRLQLAGWQRVIDAALVADRAQVFQHWHYLYSLLFGRFGPGSLSEVLPVLEEFLQSATLGQLELRLSLLAVFGAQCGVCAATAATDAWRGWRALEVGLGNVAAYYAQHLQAVQGELHKALAPIRKELRVRFCHFRTVLLW